MRRFWNYFITPSYPIPFLPFEDLIDTCFHNPHVLHHNALLVSLSKAYVCVSLVISDITRTVPPGFFRENQVSPGRARRGPGGAPRISEKASKLFTKSNENYNFEATFLIFAKLFIFIEKFYSFRYNFF